MGSSAMGSSAASASTSTSSPTVSNLGLSPCKRARSPNPPERKGKAPALSVQPSATPTHDLLFYVKSMDGEIISVHLPSEALVADLRTALLRKTGGADGKLLYMGRPLADERSLEDSNLQKECTITWINRIGRAVAVQREVGYGSREDSGGSDGDGDRVGANGSSSGLGYGMTEAVAERQPRLRPQYNGRPEYDGSDGWAVVIDMDVDAAQAWYRRSQKSLQWEVWWNGNELCYLMNRESIYGPQVASFLSKQMGATAFKSCPPHSWPHVRRSKTLPPLPAAPSPPPPHRPLSRPFYQPSCRHFRRPDAMYASSPLPSD